MLEGIEQSLPGESSNKINDILVLSKRMKEVSDASHFSVEKVLGHGSAGAVLLCKFNVVGTLTNKEIKVAVKILFNFGNSTNTIKNKFETERIILTELPFHTNIIQILHHFVAPPTEQMIDLLPEHLKKDMIQINPKSKKRTVRKTQFVVMEAYPTSLKQYIDEKGADITNLESLRFCAGISRGLLFLWNHKIVHRDIKLDNILLSSDNIPAICDFGMAITVDDTRKTQSFGKSRRK